MKGGGDRGCVVKGGVVKNGGCGEGGVCLLIQERVSASGSRGSWCDRSPVPRGTPIPLVEMATEVGSYATFWNASLCL